MGFEQGYGGPVERSRRSLSTSAAPVAKGDGEPINETDVQQMQPPPQSKTESDNSAHTAHAIHSPLELPRRCQAAVGASSPGSSSLSSSCCPSAHTPVSESCKTHRPSRHCAPLPWPIEPPVTRSTLSELDVSKIIHNPKLRHDINFDPELHFRPNLDGEKGRKKQERANQFWRTLKEDLSEFLLNRPAFYDKHGERNDWTLPALLKAVKEIIQTLVPQRDRQFLDEGFNVDLLMQQFHKGIADLEKLALWLSRVLKSHCAPMRDDWVDTMYVQLSSGNRNANLDELVTGMRSLLSVLEAMKLDVANHQIRCLRPVLIEDTSHFEQKFFWRKIQTRKMDIGPARRWYQEAYRKYSSSLGSRSQPLGDMKVFFEALTRLVLPSSAEKRVPCTFLFDEERLLKLKSDVLDFINLEVCMRIYEDLERVGQLSAGMLGAARIAEDGSLSWSDLSGGDFNFNTPPSSSRASSLSMSPSGSASSSPRSSLSGMPLYELPEEAHGGSKSRAVYGSLVALLQSATPTLRPYARWQELAPSMAVEIFRSTKAPSEMLVTLENKLSESVCKPTSQLYLDVEQSFHDRLMTELGRRVREFRGLTGVSLFAVATGSRAQSSGSGSGSGSGASTIAAHLARDRGSDALLRDGQEGGVEDIAVRLGHLGVLHWRVWSEMAYADDTGDSASLDVLPTHM